MRPEVMFDASALNKIEDGGPASEPLMRGLECGFGVVLSAISADELIATTGRGKREKLLARFRRLLSSAKCIWPPHEVIRALVSAHLADTSRFDWTKVNVRAREYEVGIPGFDIGDELSSQQKKHQDKAKKDFANMWRRIRPQLDAVLAKDPSKRPANYREAVTIAALDGGILWGFGRALYGYVSRNEPTELDIKAFMEICPPFRAACFGLVMAWYNGSLRMTRGLPSAKRKRRDPPGRNDLLMALYLPYCTRFITADDPQADALREVALEAGLDCEVQSFEDFQRTFAILP